MEFPAVAAGSARETRSTLRFLTCGSVDDGKSTLIGRLLYEQGAIFDDQLAMLERDSRRHGTVGDATDFALLVDGLEAEREQGITIDVAYRYFSTPRRSFIVADTPGHEQYTRNMATGASNADLAILLVDARKGLLPQTKRHAYIVSLLGIRDVVLAVNKIDLVGYDSAVFEAIEREFRLFAEQLALSSVTAIPVSARFGDNLSELSVHMPWYRGMPLVSFLEQVDVSQRQSDRPFRFPVQLVSRPHLDFRGYAGTIVAGRVSPGDKVLVAASGQLTSVARVIGPDGDMATADAGDVVTLTITDDVDIARGDVLSDLHRPPSVADQFAAHVIWMGEHRMLPGRSYLMKLATRTVPVTITQIKYRVDINSLQQIAAQTLSLNEIGVCNFSSATAIAMDPYTECRATGSFILIDRASNSTVGAGLIDFSLRRAANIAWQELTVDRHARALMKGQRPVVVWFTGLSGSGKSTIANLVERQLHSAGHHTYMLDGDNVRHGLNRDLGFTESDRVENIRRVAEVAALMMDAGLIVLVSFISPYRAERQMARELMGEESFIEVFVDASVEECRRRDPKGLYAKVDAGLIHNFTGIDAPYEPPSTPEVHVKTTETTPKVAASMIEEVIVKRGETRSTVPASHP